MEQHYKIINVTHKEVINPCTWDNGAKLMEWAYQENDMVKALEYLLRHAWEGDNVLICGNYLEPSEKEKDEVFYEAIKKAEEALECNGKSLYQRALEDDFTEIAPIWAESCSNKNVFKFDFENAPGYGKQFHWLYNVKKREYIDLKALPIEYTYWKDKENCVIGKCSISPLVLLLTAGNGRGGGDYYGPLANNQELVGSWCGTSKSIHFHNKAINIAPELIPNFTENGIDITREESEEKIKEEIRDMKISALMQFKSEGYFDSIEGYEAMIPEDFEALADAWCEGQPVMEAAKLFFKEKMEDKEL